MSLVLEGNFRVANRTLILVDSMNDRPTGSSRRNIVLYDPFVRIFVKFDGVPLDPDASASNIGLSNLDGSIGAAVALTRAKQHRRNR